MKMKKNWGDTCKEPTDAEKALAKVKFCSSYKEGSVNSELNGTSLTQRGIYKQMFSTANIILNDKRLIFCPYN